MSPGARRPASAAWPGRPAGGRAGRTRARSSRQPPAGPTRRAPGRRDGGRRTGGAWWAWSRRASAAPGRNHAPESNRVGTCPDKAPACHPAVPPSLVPNLMTPKPPSAGTCRMTSWCLPNDTNTLGNLMGGRLLHLMDICAAISAQRHSQPDRRDGLRRLGRLSGGDPAGRSRRVARPWSRARSRPRWRSASRSGPRTTGGHERHCNRAYYTFVAVDSEAGRSPSRRSRPKRTRNSHATSRPVAVGNCASCWPVGSASRTRRSCGTISRGGA